MKRVFIFFIQIYRVYISPFLNRYGSCRYEPSCSEYMQQALHTFGVKRGLWYGLRRMLSCHPFSQRPHYDPVENIEK